MNLHCTVHISIGAPKRFHPQLVLASFCVHEVSSWLDTRNVLHRQRICDNVLSAHDLRALRVASHDIGITYHACYLRPLLPLFRFVILYLEEPVISECKSNLVRLSFILRAYPPPPPAYLAVRVPPLKHKRGTRMLVVV